MDRFSPKTVVLDPTVKLLDKNVDKRKVVIRAHSTKTSFQKWTIRDQRNSKTLKGSRKKFHDH